MDGPKWEMHEMHNNDINSSQFAIIYDLADIVCSIFCSPTILHIRLSHQKVE